MLETRPFFSFLSSLLDDMKNKKRARQQERQQVNKKKLGTYGGHVDKEGQKDSKEDKVGRSTEATKPPMPLDLKT